MATNPFLAALQRDDEDEDKVTKSEARGNPFLQVLAEKDKEEEAKTQEEDRRKQIDDLLNKGWSFEDISKQTGSDVQKVKQYADFTRPGYGVKDQGPSNLEKAGAVVTNFAKGAVEGLTGLAKETGGRLADNFGGIVSGERRGPGAEAIIQQQEQAKQVLPADLQERAAANLLNEDRLKLLELVNQGAKPTDIGKFIDEAKQRKRQADIQQGGATLEAASFAVGGGGLKQAFSKGGAKAAATSLATTTGSGAFGNVGATLREDPEASREDIQSSALVGGLFGAGADVAAAGLGKLFRRPPKSLGEATKVAGKVDSELSTALSKVDDKQLKIDLQTTFGSNVKKEAEAIAERTGIPTSRTKQFFTTAEKELVELAEADPTFAEVGGRQSVNDTLLTAAKRGFIDLTQVQPGQKVDAVDVARARMSMATYMDEARAALNSNDPAKITEAIENFKQANQGYSVITSEPGRATQIQSQFDNKMVKAFEVVADYQNTLASGQPLTPGQRQVMTETLREAAQELEVGRADRIKNGLWAGDTSLVRKLEEWSTAAKLTSPVTSMRNIIGNTLTFANRAAEQGIANLLGAAQGRTSIKSLPKVLGTRSGYKAATAKGWEIMKDAALLRQTSDNLRQGEGFKNAIGGKFGEAVRIPFKFLEAADEFGKTILRDSRLNQEAFELATKEGFRGEDLVNRVDELLKAPTEGMIKAADADAITHTFQTPLGKTGTAAQNFINSMPGGKFFVPFLKTPTNIVKYQLTRSAVGAPGQIVKGVAKRGTREGDEAIARAFMGTALSLGTLNWVRENQDFITGAAPKDQAERDAFYAEGKQPFAIRIGDKWVGYQNFQPMGLYLLQAKALSDAMDKNDDKSAGKIALDMAQIAAQGVLELPFVSGMANVVEALADPEKKAESFVADVLKGGIPNAVRDIRLYQDKIIRAPKNLKEEIMDMIPGLSEQLDPRTTTLGTPAERKESALGRSLLRAFGTTAQEQPEEYRILNDVAKNTEYTPSAPARTQRGVKMDDDQYNVYQQQYYQTFQDKLSQVIRAESFQSANWETKKDVIEELVRLSGEETRDRLFGQKETTRRSKEKESTTILKGVGLR